VHVAQTGLVIGELKMLKHFAIHDSDRESCERILDPWHDSCVGRLTSSEVFLMFRSFGTIARLEMRCFYTGRFIIVLIFLSRYWQRLESNSKHLEYCSTHTHWPRNRWSSPGVIIPHKLKGVQVSTIVVNRENQIRGKRRSVCHPVTWTLELNEMSCRPIWSILTQYIGER
jgi:hypothetical protein